MRTLTINAKCSDLCFSTLKIDEKTYENDGYVPSGLGIGGGDYVEFTVDLDTGHILEWTSPSEEVITEVLTEDFGVNSDKDDDEDEESFSTW